MADSDYSSEDDFTDDITPGTSRERNRYDPSAWCQLADLEIKAGKPGSAMNIYTKAIKFDSNSKTLHEKRLELAVKLEKPGHVLIFKKKMIKCLPQSDFKDIIQNSKELAEHYYEEKNYTKALEVLQITFKRVPSKVPPDLVNMMLDLLIITRQFAKCLNIFGRHGGFIMEYKTVDVPNSKETVLNSYKMPPNVEIEIKVKFVLCLVKLKIFHLALPLIHEMTVEERIAEIGDAFLDVAEDLMAADFPHEASTVLHKLTRSKKYDLAAVWLKYGECLDKCDMLKQAIEAYRTVIKLSPESKEAALSLLNTSLILDKIICKASQLIEKD